MLIVQVGGLPLLELNHLEIQFLTLNRFRLLISPEEMEAYGTKLVEFYAQEVYEQHMQLAASAEAFRKKQESIGPDQGPGSIFDDEGRHDGDHTDEDEYHGQRGSDWHEGADLHDDDDDDDEEEEDDEGTETQGEDLHMEQ